MKLASSLRDQEKSVATPAPPLLVFADDWGRHPSSCQHLVRRLLPHRHVDWVNTIGMRTPRLDRATLRRGLEKFRHWFRPIASEEAAPPPANLRVLNPRMWPWFTSPLDRRLNRRLLLRALRPAIEALPEAPVAITTLPIVADLMGALPVRRWVYYCVDDFTQWPGLDQRTLRDMEETVVRKADVVVAVSETLRERLAGMGRSSLLLTHGTDPAHWGGDDGNAFEPAAGLERPLVVFWGVVDPRMETEWVRRLAADMTAGTVLLVGPENDADPALAALPRVARRPAVRYEELPALARAASVLVMPYADLPVTRAMQPLKLKEYLATGKPVVVSRLPATEPWADCLDLAGGAEEFSAAVRTRLRDGVGAGQRAARAGRLAGETWAAKASLFEAWAAGREL